MTVQDAAIIFVMRIPSILSYSVAKPRYEVPEYNNMTCRGCAIPVESSSIQLLDDSPPCYEEGEALFKLPRIDNCPSCLVVVTVFTKLNADGEMVATFPFCLNEIPPFFGFEYFCPYKRYGGKSFFLVKHWSNKELLNRMNIRDL